MIGNYERMFRILLYDNAYRVINSLLYPICKSIANPPNEITALNNSFSEIKKIGKNSISLTIPNSLKSFGFFGRFVIVKASKTHSRIAKFKVSEKTNEY